MRCDVEVLPLQTELDWTMIWDSDRNRTRLGALLLGLAVALVILVAVIGTTVATLIGLIVTLPLLVLGAVLLTPKTWDSDRNRKRLGALLLGLAVASVFLAAVIGTTAAAWVGWTVGTPLFVSGGAHVTRGPPRPDRQPPPKAMVIASNVFVVVLLLGAVTAHLQLVFLGGVGMLLLVLGAWILSVVRTAHRRSSSSP